MSSNNKKMNVKIDNGTLIDEHGELWLQETATAWRRESDRFWWEGTTISLDNLHGQKPPTVEDILNSKVNTKVN